MAPSDKLYYSPQSCGAASFIAQSIAGLNLDTIEVDLKAHKTKKTGDDYYKINPKGNVPFLSTSKGSLSEGAAILQYIADQAPDSKLAPANGTFERYQLQDTFNYVGTELHKSIAPMFGPAFDDNARRTFVELFRKKLEYLNKGRISDDPAFSTQQPTIAGIYAWVVLSWVVHFGIDVADYPKVKQFSDDLASNSKFAEARKKLAAASQ